MTEPKVVYVVISGVFLEDEQAELIGIFSKLADADEIAREVVMRYATHPVKDRLMVNDTVVDGVVTKTHMMSGMCYVDIVRSEVR